MRRGFTLVEVMMAAGIIGLGVLGLIALLAGAARVQQTSSKTSQSVLIAKNAGALVQQSLSSIEIDPRVSVSPLVDDQWYMIPKHPNDNYLTIDQSSGVWPVSRSGEPAPLVLWERVIDPTTGAPDPPSQTGNTGLLAPPAVGGRNQYANAFIENLLQRRILADSLVFRVRTIETPVAPDFEEEGAQETLYLRPAGAPQWPRVSTLLEPGVPTFSSLNGPAASNPSEVRFYRNGNATLHCPVCPDPDFIEVDIQFVNPGQNDVSYIRQFNISDVRNNPGTRIIDEIVLENQYDYINPELVSLGDRVTFAPDESRIDGRRPEFAFSLLYRTLSSGGSQAGIFMYGLQPPSRDAQWNPMEEVNDIQNDGTSPVVQVGQETGLEGISQEVLLGFEGGDPDDDPTPTYQYFIEVDEDLEWVVAPGQVVLVGWEPTIGGGMGSGADDAVTVTRRVRGTSDSFGAGRVRGYLDRGPRAQNQSFVELDPSTVETTRVSVWVVRDVAMSEGIDDDQGGNGLQETTWRLRPLRFLVFQLDG